MFQLVGFVGSGGCLAMPASIDRKVSSCNIGSQVAGNSSVGRAGSGGGADQVRRVAGAVPL
jgi:hypothetical protein